MANKSFEMHQYSICQMMEKITVSLEKLWGTDTARAYMKIKQVDLRLARCKKGDWIVDVGAGLGLDDFVYAWIGANCVAVELRQSDIVNGRKMAYELGVSSNMYHIIGDARCLPFRNECFDVSVSYSSIEHIPNRDESRVWIREMTRVTKVSGEVVLTTSNRLWLLYPLLWLVRNRRIKKEFFFRPEEIKRELIANGVKVVAFEANILYSTWYNLIPLFVPGGRRFNMALESFSNWFARFGCFKIVCGRMGFRGKKFVENADKFAVDTLVRRVGGE